ncbi:MAG TPA: DUF3417 domain-containing protein, partial [Actinomycetes bacterium]
AAVELAGWKGRVRSAWGGVRVDHVESVGVADSPHVGQRLALRVFVSLGELKPDDVDVQAVHGQVGSDDELVRRQFSDLQPVEAYEGGRWRYEGELTLDRAGAFGYTVRVLPRNEYLASPAEMNLVAAPPTSAGLTEGDLR